MATAAKRPSSAKRPAKGRGVVLPENHSPSEAIAHAISTEYNDLTPSVTRIMESDLGEAGRLHAITLFRDSLGKLGDPYRNPANAIEAGRQAEEATAPQES
jgi:hypothetical protein